jgi:hypothetical protein
MTDQPMELDLEAETDRLYQLPLDQFVEARNALARRVKAGGHKEEAARVKALARPVASAWAANQVYWTARREFDALVASAERLRSAQLQGALGGPALREATKSRREAHERALGTAASLLASAGHGSSAATLLRVSKTLEALAAARGEPTGARAGRLVEDLEPPGFEALAALALDDAGAPPPKEVGSPPRAPDSGPGPSAGAVFVPAVEPELDLRAGEVQRLEEALATSEQRLERARRDSREAAGALSVAAKRAEAARVELVEATRRLERAQERAASTARDEAAARTLADGSATSRDDAEAERDAALRALRGAQ